MKCHKCGHKIDNNDKYCTDCGNKLNKSGFFSGFTYALFAFMLFVSVFSLDGALNTVASNVKFEGSNSDAFISTVKTGGFIVLGLIALVLILVIINSHKKQKQK